MTRILVIEDARDLRDDVIEMLSMEGFEAVGAENGATGLVLAQSFKPDLIVCDIMMPEMDGYEVLEQLRKNPRTAVIPFIFLTARTDRLNVRQGMVLGADDYLTKPFLVAELLDSIASQLKKRTELNEDVEKRMNELRENIITALPHEVRTPLNTIIGFSDMLLMEAQRIKPDQIAGWASHINQAAHRLYHLVENYLFYARLQVTSSSPDFHLEIENSTLPDAHILLETLVFKIAQTSERENDVQIQIDEAPLLRCSYNDLVKMIDELLDNAVKFSEPGQKIVVTAAAQEDAYQICIYNEGRGITEEQIQQIGAMVQFERWFYEQQGMGLGLTIVKRLVELYQAKLDISTPPEGGTKVCLLLKQAK